MVIKTDRLDLINLASDPAEDYRHILGSAKPPQYIFTLSIPFFAHFQCSNIIKRKDCSYKSIQI